MYDSIYQRYVDNVKIICDNNDISNFKSNNHFKEILEHINVYLGYDYLRLILNTTNLTINDVIHITKINDCIGNTFKDEFYYDSSNSFFCSPTSLRYIYHSHLILSHMIKLGENNVDIVEIGGGYGGLCLCLHEISKMYNIQIKSYTIIDLTQIIRLQKMYLKENGINNVNFIDSDTFGKDINQEGLFLISNYAFSEINSNFQRNYISNLFHKVKHGFMVWNYIDVYDFGFETEVIDENPMTGNENKYVYF